MVSRSLERCLLSLWWVSLDCVTSKGERFGFVASKINAEECIGQRKGLNRIG